jgi:hypothetical protein
MFQDPFHYDNAKVNATLDGLNQDYIKNNKIYDKLQAVGACSLYPCSPDAEVPRKGID